MKKQTGWFLVLGLTAAFSMGARISSAADTSYEAEKAKALAQPYANDFGPATIDVSGYPAEMQDTYKNLLSIRCARCHQPSRPLNSQFVEPAGDKSGHA